MSVWTVLVLLMSTTECDGLAAKVAATETVESQWHDTVRKLEVDLRKREADRTYPEAEVSAARRAHQEALQRRDAAASAAVTARSNYARSKCPALPTPRRGLLPTDKGDSSRSKPG